HRPRRLRDGALGARLQAPGRLARRAARRHPRARAGDPPALAARGRGARDRRAGLESAESAAPGEGLHGGRCPRGCPRMSAAPAPPPDPEREAFARLLAVCRRLRGPDGCPWDREQTLESMTPYLTEEAAESVEAIGNADADHAAEELGDLAFLVIFCLELARERWGVGVAEAFDRAAEKLIRRHPHVYGDARVSDGESAYRQWQEIKRAEKPDAKGSLLGEQPKGLPALVAAYRIQEKAAAVGFDWPTTEGPLAKVREETDEVA